MKISGETKVSEVIKTSSKAIDALISISAKFNKLRNPLLRKIMAPRVTLEQAAKIGGIRTEDLFSVLSPLGFEAEEHSSTNGNKKKEEKAPAFLEGVKEDDILFIDVRPMLANGEDPLNYILKRIKEMKVEQVFCIINSFEPIPLIHLLEKKGYESFVKYTDADQVGTYFHKVNSDDEPQLEPKSVDSVQEDFAALLEQYQGHIVETDVRNLEMPLPMLTILDILETLPDDNILFVHHKKIPVYLLPELESKGFEYFIQEIAEGDVKLIIRHKS